VAVTGVGSGLTGATCLWSTSGTCEVDVSAHITSDIRPDWLVSWVSSLGSRDQRGHDYG